MEILLLSFRGKFSFLFIIIVIWKDVVEHPIEKHVPCSPLGAGVTLAGEQYKQEEDYNSHNSMGHGSAQGQAEKPCTAWMGACSMPPVLIAPSSQVLVKVAFSRYCLRHSPSLPPLELFTDLFFQTLATGGGREGAGEWVMGAGGNAHPLKELPFLAPGGRGGECQRHSAGTQPHGGPRCLSRARLLCLAQHTVPLSLPRSVSHHHCHPQAQCSPAPRTFAPQVHHYLRPVPAQIDIRMRRNL